MCETIISATEKKKNLGRQKDRMLPYWDEIEILNGGVKEDLIEKVRCEKNPKRCGIKLHGDLEKDPKMPRSEVGLCPGSSKNVFGAEGRREGVVGGEVRVVWWPGQVTKGLYTVRVKMLALALSEMEPLKNLSRRVTLLDLHLNIIYLSIRFEIS